MRALVLPGGGAKGAWQVGAVHALAILGARYDIITGISVGAINGAFLSMYAPHRLAVASTDLKLWWKGIDNRAIRKRWLLWPLSALWRQSAYNSKPLETLLRKHISPERLQDSGTKFRCGAVSLNSGEYRTWDQDHPDIVEAVLASASFPCGLKPITLDGEQWTDGGVRTQNPIQEAIDMGATQCDILTLHSDIEPRTRKMRLPGIGAMALEILLDEVVRCDLIRAKQVNELVRAGALPMRRHVDLRIFEPSQPLGPSLDFNPGRIRSNLETGYRDIMRQAGQA